MPNRNRAPARASQLRIGITVALLTATCIVSDCVDRETFECNLAVAIVADCCPEIDPTALNCERGFACDANEPLLKEEESECITALSCDEIRSQGGCEDIARLSCVDVDG